MKNLFMTSRGLGTVLMLIVLVAAIFLLVGIFSLATLPSNFEGSTQGSIFQKVRTVFGNNCPMAYCPNFCTQCPSGYSGGGCVYFNATTCTCMVNPCLPTGS